jgi:hypothetical protein
LIAEVQRDGQTLLYITHPTADRVVGAVFVALSLLVLYAYFAGGPNRLVEAIVMSAFCLSFFLLGLSILRERITVARSFVEERRLIRKSRRIELPNMVIVDSNGPQVCVREEDGEFQYWFSDYLNHGTKLEERLRAFFENRSDDVATDGEGGGV